MSCTEKPVIASLDLVSVEYAAGLFGLDPERLLAAIKVAGNLPQTGWIGALVESRWLNSAAGQRCIQSARETQEKDKP
jgi:hypothetical protein